MSIPENNGTPPTVREWNDSRASRRAVPTLPRPTSDPLRLFVRVVLLFVLLLVLALLVSPAGAAERRSAVVIAEVRGDAGFYVVKLESGAIFVVTPPRRAPQLVTGAALMDSGALWQGGWRYAINRRAVKR